MSLWSQRPNQLKCFNAPCHKVLAKSAPQKARVCDVAEFATTVRKSQKLKGHIWVKNFVWRGPILTKPLWVHQKWPLGPWKAPKMAILSHIWPFMPIGGPCCPKWVGYWNWMNKIENDISHLEGPIGQNAKTCWDGPDKMPTKKLGRTKCQPLKKGRTKCQPLVGIMSGWHFVRTPSKRTFGAKNANMDQKIHDL